MKFRLDPSPKLTQTLLNCFLNARMLIFAVVVAKITLDRLYKYAMIINPLGYDSDGEATLDILEYQHPTTSNDVFYALNSYGAKGRQAYLTYLFYDIVFVTARTIPIIVICSWAYKQAPESKRPGVWIPVLNWAADLLESFFIFGLIKAFPSRNKTVELITAYVIRFKWLTFQATLILLFISLLVGVYYAFHSLLADSVLLEKDRQKKLVAREQVQDVLKKSAARREAAASASRSSKKDT